MIYRHFFKRLIDVIVALSALPFVLLVIAIAGFMIHLTDHGPVFYNAVRLGKDGKPYKMFKLRSMKINAPDIRNTDGSTYNGENDFRVTRIGKFLRKTSLDEFPQFLNVLLGDMSIIGPRPTVPLEGFVLTRLSPMEKKRYQVKPGITGYSQAYYRNAISQEEKFQNDAYYAEHVSFLLDVKIFIKTIQSVLQRENIYIK